jgi:hypothetical protein
MISDNHDDTNKFAVHQELRCQMPYVTAE